MAILFLVFLAFSFNASLEIVPASRVFLLFAHRGHPSGNKFLHSFLKQIAQLTSILSYHVLFSRHCFLSNLYYFLCCSSPSCTKCEMEAPIKALVSRSPAWRDSPQMSSPMPSRFSRLRRCRFCAIQKLWNPPKSRASCRRTSPAVTTRRGSSSS